MKPQTGQKKPLLRQKESVNGTDGIPSEAEETWTEEVLDWADEAPAWALQEEAPTWVE